MRYGSWWAVQWGSDRLLELGVHIEWRWWLRTNDGTRYGPYVDLHLPGAVLSVGINPIYAGETHLKASYSRGGLNANHDQGG